GGCHGQGDLRRRAGDRHTRARARGPVAASEDGEAVVEALYSYQEAGVDWLLNADGEPLRAQAAYNADEMGLGKTVQAIVAARKIREYTGNHVSCLVIGPASIIPGWEREWQRWFDDGKARS